MVHCIAHYMVHYVVHYMVHYMMHYMVHDMMQDFPKLLPPEARVGFADFERWFSFSPVKVTAM